ncbi:MAG: hypothetical protein QW334_00115, partial [Thermofilum sp.]
MDENGLKKILQCFSWRDLKDLDEVEEPVFEKILQLNPALAFIPEKNMCIISTRIFVEKRRFKTNKKGERELVLIDYQSQRYLLISAVDDYAKMFNIDFIYPVVFKKYDAETLLELGIKPKPGLVPPERVSPIFLKKVVDYGGIKKEDIPEPRDVYNNIKNLLLEYFEFQDEETYEFVAAWILGTYFYTMFLAYPYLFIGGIKRTGKTKLLYFIFLSAFNAIFSVNMSTAALFRYIDECGATILLDETEDLNDPQRRLDVRSILLGGYKSGGLVHRVEGDRRKRVEDFDVYSPKAMANIYGVEDVLSDRAITIIMIRSLNTAITEKNINQHDPIWQEIRDKLTALTLTRWRELYDISRNFKNPSNKITAREYELWHPIFCIWKWIGGDELVQKMLPWVETKAEEKQIIELNDNRDLTLLKTLVEHVDRDGEYSLSEIRDWFKAEFQDEEQKWLNNKWIGSALRRLGFKDSRLKGGRYHYFIPKNRLCKIAVVTGVLSPGDLGDLGDLIRGGGQHNKISPLYSHNV